MRISSFIYHAKKFAEEIIVIDYGGNDQTKLMSESSEAKYFSNKKNLWKSILSKEYNNQDALIINIDQDTYLKKIDEIIEIRNARKNDLEVRLNYNIRINDVINNQDKLEFLIENFEDISWILFNKIAFEKIVLNQNNLKSVEKINLESYKNNNVINKINNKNEDVKKHSLRTKNPLILFGIPGLIMVISSFILVLSVVSKYGSIDSVSLGTAIVTVGTTIIGIISLMVALISYILGKQTEFILTNYSK